MELLKSTLYTRSIMQATIAGAGWPAASSYFATAQHGALR